MVTQKEENLFIFPHVEIMCNISKLVWSYKFRE